MFTKSGQLYHLSRPRNEKKVGVEEDARVDKNRKRDRRNKPLKELEKVASADRVV